MQKISTNKQAQLEAIKQKYGYGQKDRASSNSELHRSGRKEKNNYESRRMDKEFNVPSRLKPNNANDQSSKIFRNSSNAERELISAETSSPFRDQLISKRR